MNCSRAPGRAATEEASAAKTRISAERMVEVGGAADGGVCLERSDIKYRTRIRFKRLKKE